MTEKEYPVMFQGETKDGQRKIIIDILRQLKGIEKKLKEILDII